MTNVGENARRTRADRRREGQFPPRRAIRSRSSRRSPKSKWTPKPESTASSIICAVADVGTVHQPAGLAGNCMAAGYRASGTRGARNRLRPALRHVTGGRFHHNKPPTILDIPLRDAVGRREHSRSGNPVGAKGVGEAAALARQRRDAVRDSERGIGDRCRAPHAGNTRPILASLAAR